MDTIDLKCIYLYFVVICVQLSMANDSGEQDELIRIINSNPKNTWVAGYNNISYEPSFYFSNGLNLKLQNDKEMKSLREYFSLFAFGSLPSVFDARTKWGPSAKGDPDDKCPTINKVYNNGKCKCGWAISIASVMSDRLCISSSYEFRKPLSAQQLISCCKSCCSCNGGNIQLGWEYVKQKGLVTGGAYNSNLGCQPFLIPPCEKSYVCSTNNVKTPECWENTCKPAETNPNKTQIIESNKRIRVEDYYSFSREKPTKIMRELMEHGPLQVSMHMYQDFRVYTKGIYSHVSGDFISDHGVKLIGWGIEDGIKYWLLMNSFGTLWGERGLFRISMDGTDNTDFGFAIIAPTFPKSMAQTTRCCIFLICIMQIIIDL